MLQDQLMVTLELLVFNSVPGDVCTSYEDETYLGNLARCQRYYEKSYEWNTPVIVLLMVLQW